MMLRNVKPLLVLVTVLSALLISGLTQTLHSAYPLNNILAIPMVEGDTKIDGMLDDPQWGKATWITGFVSFNTKNWVNHQTKVKMYYTPEAVYAGIECYEPQISKIVSTVAKRDGHVWENESIELFFTEQSTYQSYYHFVINSSGTVYDETGKGGKTWNAQGLTLAVTRTTYSWITELKLPFNDIGIFSTPVPGSYIWCNFARNAVKRKDYTMWAKTDPDYHQPDQFGQLIFNSTNTCVQVTDVPKPYWGKNVISFTPFPSGFRGRVTQVAGNMAVKTPPTPLITTDYWSEVKYWILSNEVTDIEITIRDEGRNPIYRTWYSVTLSSPAYSVDGIRAELNTVKQYAAKLEKSSPETYEKVMRSLSGLDDEILSIEQRLKDYEELTGELWDTAITRLESIGLQCRKAVLYVNTLSVYPDAKFAVGYEPPMRKVFISSRPVTAEFRDNIKVELAKNESEAFQVVVIPITEKLVNVSVTVSDLLSADKKSVLKPGKDITTGIMGYVHTADPSRHYRVDFVGWWPDPILDFLASASYEKEETGCFWVNIHAGTDTPAGVYKGKLTVNTEGQGSIVLGLEITVWNFELPQQPSLPTAFSYYDSFVKNIYKSSWTKELDFSYRGFILDHRVSPDYLYRRTFMDQEILEYSMPRGMTMCNLKYIYDPKKVFTDEFRQKTKSEYEAMLPVLRRLNAMDRICFYGFDEINKETFPIMKDIFGYLKTIAPEVPTMTTAYDHSFGLETGLDCVDIWVPLTPKYNLDLAEKVRAKGKKVWWYTCIGPKHPYANWFVEYPAIEARLLLGAMSFKYKTDGYLYYAMTRWPNNTHPIESGPYTDWNPASFDTSNGDGSILCPGPKGPLSTIRFENIRDGLEDYEYFYMLRNLYEKAKSKRKLDTKLVAEIEAALAVDDKVVKTLTDFTHDPETLYAMRRKVAELILKLQK